MQKNLWFLQDVLYLTAAWLLRARSFYFTMKENKSWRTAVKHPREEDEIPPGITMMRLKSVRAKKKNKNTNTATNTVNRYHYTGLFKKNEPIS